MHVIEAERIKHSKQEIVTIEADGVNVREGPGINYPVIQRVNKNDQYLYLSEQGDWFELQLPDGKQAWVAGWLATKITQQEQMTEHDSDFEEGQKTEQGPVEEQTSVVAVVTTDDLRIREGPDVTKRIIGHLNRGDIVDIISSHDDWVQITSPAGDGWVSAQYITKQQKNEATVDERKTRVGVVMTKTLNMRESPSIQANIVGKLYANNEVTIISENGDWLEITYGQQTGWINKQYVYIEQAKQENIPSDTTDKDRMKRQIGTITASSINVRKKPSLKAKVVGSVEKKQQFSIVEEKNNWVKIEYKQKKFGWIAGWYVERGLEKVENPKTKKKKIKKSYATILYPETNIRKEANAQSPVVTRVHQGDRLRIIGMENNWYKVKLKKGTEAFVAGWLVNTSGPVPKVEKTGPELYVKNKTIVIDAGHGGRDNGTTGAAGTIEKRATLKTAQVVADKLREAGANVILTRTNDAYVSLGERVMMSNYHEADAFISIHFDNSDDANVRGMTSYYYYEPFKQMVEHIHMEIVSATKLRDRGTRHGDYFVLRENRHNSALLELGYLSNSTEEAYVTTAHFHELVANGIYQGLAHYFKSG